MFSGGMERDQWLKSLGLTLLNDSSHFARDPFVLGKPSFFKKNCFESQREQCLTNLHFRKHLEAS